jgi:hypothetical protein
VALRRCQQEGRLVACDAVFAEVASAFNSGEEMSAAMRTMRVEYEPTSFAAAVDAGDVFRTYRRRGGSRGRVVADFLIAAHALRHADRLLSRDRGFFRTYFKELEVVDPSAEA